MGSVVVLLIATWMCRIGHMDYIGGNDYKRANLYRPRAPRRRSIGDLPPDYRPPSESGRVKNSVTGTLRLLLVGSVLTPSILGAFAGSLLLIFADGNQSAERIGQGLIVGASISGLFAWTQAIAGQVQRRNDLRVQVGLVSDLRRADLVGLQVNDVFLRGRQLSGARLSRSRMHGGDFSGAEMIDTRMTKASFFESVFDDAKMIAIGGFETDFRGCSFARVDLTRAILAQADLRGANLRSANLSHADLRGADLRRAKIDEATTMTGCWYDHQTLWPDGFDPSAQADMHELSEVYYELDDELIDLRDLALMATEEKPRI